MANEQQQSVAVAGAKSATVSMAAGGLVLTSLGEVAEFAKTMASAGLAVPKHLRGNPGACFSVILNAIEWRMSPFAVANKSYSVNDRLAYEAQLVAAVILQRAPLRGRPKYEFMGEGPSLQCKVSVRTTDDEVLDYTSPKLKDITVKNSPLWKSDPEQQLGYYSVRALSRRHFPDVLLGVYAEDEMPREPPPPKDVTPTKQPTTIAGKLDKIAARQQPTSTAPAPDLTPEELAALAALAAEPEQPEPVARDANGQPTGERVDPETGVVWGADEAVEVDDDAIDSGPPVHSDPEEVFAKPDPKTLYLQACEEVMRTAIDAEQLAKWWSVPKNREQRKLWLSVDEANELKARVITRVEELKGGK